MPTIKIKRLNYDADDTFLALKPHIVYTKDGLTIKDNDLYFKLERAEKNSKLVASLREENNQLKEKQIAMPIVIAERDRLREQLANTPEKSKSFSQYKDQVDKYKSEINKLKSQEEKYLSQIQGFNDKIKSLEKDNQDIQKESQELQASNKELSKSTEDHEDIKEIFNKWGTYQSLQKDIAIVQFFMDRPDEKIRQLTVIKAFKHVMDHTTCRLHLYGLVKKGVLVEPEFKGTYVFHPHGFDEMAVDMDRIANLILGKNLYEMAVDQHQQEDEDSEY